jgi:serine/threonine protein kinase
VTNGIPLGCSLLLPVHTVNCVQTLKDSITLKAVLGKGNFGVVRLGDLWANSDAADAASGGAGNGGAISSAVQVAVKTAKKDKMNNNTFLSEAAVMKHLQHKNIIKLYGVHGARMGFEN